MEESIRRATEQMEKFGFVRMTVHEAKKRRIAVQDLKEAIKIIKFYNGLAVNLTVAEVEK